MLKQVVYKTLDGRITGAVIINSQFQKGLAGEIEVETEIDELIKDAKATNNGSLILEVPEPQV